MNVNVEETLPRDKNGEGAISGDAPSMNQVKDTSVASVEELQNLAGGSDIKVASYIILKCYMLIY